MNYVITTIISACFLLFSVFVVPYNDIEKAFNTGNAAKIMELGTSKVLISIEGEEGAYSKSQGTQVLTNFFKNNPPKSFIFKFKGNEEGPSAFAVGEYQSTTKLFRVSFKLKEVNKNYFIESLVFTVATSE
ncbi:MAG: DUF4783 domain-containing protein [Brumimicrobium sp.]|nr:DUF4783 domain-containing protein [Brumimicrobium sp.]